MSARQAQQNDKDALNCRSLEFIFSQGRTGSIFTAWCLPSLNFNGVSRLRLTFEMGTATAMCQHRSEEILPCGAGPPRSRT